MAKTRLVPKLLIGKNVLGSIPRKLRLLEKKMYSKKVLWTVGSKIRNSRVSVEKNKDYGLRLK